MGRVAELGRKLAFFLRRNHYQRELREEMELHLALKHEELSSESQARKRFGNTTLLEEDSREAWGWRSIDSAIQDLSYGLRQLRRNPGIACISVLTLTLGIGVNSAIFSIFNSILLRPMAVPNPDQVAVLGLEQKKGALQNNFSYPDFEDIRRQTSGVFSGVVTYKTGMEGLSVDGQGGIMWVDFVSGDFFSTLGVQPVLGRLILPSEDGAMPSNPVLVLGYSYWQTRFGGDPHVVGKHVSVDGRPFTIVGVVPKDFHGIGVLLDTQGYIPVGMSTVMGNPKDYLQDRSDREFSIAARLKPGSNVEQGAAALRVVANRLAFQYPKTDEALVLRIFLERYARPGPESENKVVTIAALFQLLSGLVLVVACINVANILLVRATVRQREMAVRAALGAGRRRLIRQLLTESLLLAALGGIGGVLLSLWSTNALSSIQLPTPIPLLLDFHFDWTVFLFASIVAALTGALVGIVPALRVARGDLAAVLHGTSRSVSGGRQMLRSALVVAQLSGSLALLIVGALFIRSFVNAQHTSLGFDPDNVVLLTLDPNQVGYDEARGRDFYRKLLDRVTALPGVELPAWASPRRWAISMLPVRLRFRDTSRHPEAPCR
ncbi:MAG TPA: ABC transporter permease [Bryobacteraceae bacterium]|nr:ABC transporter permease [Bryobacteraceae bacterium]